METRLKPNHITYVQIYIRLRFDVNNAIQLSAVEGAGGAVNWRLTTTDGGAATNETSTTVFDTDYHVFRKVSEIHGGSHVHFYIDPPTECANSPITTNIPDDATDYLQPFVWIRTSENALKSMDLDYVAVRQDR